MCVCVRGGEGGPNKGVMFVPFWMNFRKTSKGGGGVISDPKNYVAVFAVILREKLWIFGKRGGVTPI